MSVTELFDRGCAQSGSTASRSAGPTTGTFTCATARCLQAVLPFTAAQFARGIIMPNLVPPVTTVAMADAYRERILGRAAPTAAISAADDLLPHRHDRRRTRSSAASRTASGSPPSSIPAGATTNAHHGVTDIPALAPVLERMERIGMPVLIHGEATDPAVDIFDREAVFMENKPAAAAASAIRA